MSIALFHDTICAPSTPSGKSALAIVRVSGSDAVRIVGSIISDPVELWSARGNTSIYTNLISEGRVIDDVVITIFRAPRSYTGEDLLEITTHGSPIITEQLLSLLSNHGARLAEPGEFSRRAFFAGKIGIEEAQLITSKIDAESEASLRGAELRIREKFKTLKSLYDQIIHALALVNAQIDFGDSDDIKVEGLEQLLGVTVDVVSELIEKSQTKKQNSAYLTVALTGPPNVGKSSLFNRILQFERSIVSELPGTTRDYVEAFIELEGHKIKLVDTAGIRLADEHLEQRGIELGMSASNASDLILRVTAPDDREPETQTSEILVHNKSDLDAWNSGIAVSAKTGLGLDSFKLFILSEANRIEGEKSSSVITLGEINLLKEIKQIIIGAAQAPDLILCSEELRSAASVAGKLIGVNIGEDTLNHIFSSMCIGK